MLCLWPDRKWKNSCKKYLFYTIKIHFFFISLYSLLVFFTENGHNFILYFSYICVIRHKSHRLVCVLDHGWRFFRKGPGLFKRNLCISW